VNNNEVISAQTGIMLLIK